MKIEGFSALIQEKIENIKKRIQERTKELIDIDNQIKELSHKEEKIKSQRNAEAFASMDSLMHDFKFTKVINDKLETLRSMHSQAMVTKDEMISLYKKAFNNLSSKRIEIERNKIESIRDSLDHKDVLVLNKKGFNWAKRTWKGTLYCPTLIEDIKDLRVIFNNPEIQNLITKKDKAEMFTYFIDAFSNFMIPDDFARDESFKIKDLNIPYYKLELLGDDMNIKTSTVIEVTFAGRQCYDGSYSYRLDVQTLNDFFSIELQIDKLAFGELFILANVWEKLEDEIDSMIRKLSSIIENNRIIIDELKKKTAHILVAEEL